MIKVTYCKIPEEMNKRQFDELCSYITPDRYQRLRRFLRREDQLRSLYAELLFRVSYSEIIESDRKNSNINFITNPYGKPIILDNKNIHFNLSHSGQYVICGISDSQIGVDIEQYGAYNPGIAQTYYHNLEYQKLKEQQEENRGMYFYDLWTLKESFIKADGRGLHIPLNNFYVTMDENGAEIYGEMTDGYVVSLIRDIDPDYSCAICLKSSKVELETLEVHQVSNYDIIQC